MVGLNRGMSVSSVLPEVRAELVRRGLAKEDFERCGVTVDALDREVVRSLMERPGSITVILAEVLARIGLGGA